MSLAETLAELANAPKLDGAVCADPGSRAVFDRAAAWFDAESREQAVWACAHCPALPACKRWVEGLSEDQRPHGVVAGMLVTSGGRVRRLRRRRFHAPDGG